MFCCLLLGFIIFGGERKSVASEAGSQSSNEIEEENFVDLTELSPLVAYGELYNMAMYPEDYIGKKVKINGAYVPAYDSGTDLFYHYVLVEDVAGCCSEGLEFKVSEDLVYPDEYPELGQMIEIEGIYGSYEENGKLYYYVDTDKIQYLN